MKKAIIILTILSIITIGFTVYESILYLNTLNSLNEVSTTKSEIIDKNIELENENLKLEEDYNKKAEQLLEDNIGCYLWKNQEEALKKIKE